MQGVDSRLYLTTAPREKSRPSEAEILEENVLIRYSHANVHEVGRISNISQGIAAFRHRPFTEFVSSTAMTLKF